MKKYRERLGITTFELAKLLECSQGMVSHIETGKRKPGRMLGAQIERLTKSEQGGPIKAVDWGE